MRRESIPRPEYPRPQFSRAEWLSLNGEWEFAFDDADTGVSLGWHDGRALPSRIVVPYPYQSTLSGICDKGVHEVVWYARDLEVPAEWTGRDVAINFGAVDYRATLWVNGEEVGHNRGGHVPFAFDIAPYLRSGPNRVTLRVEDRQTPYQPRGKQSSTGTPHGVDYSCTTGIWQPVWLEPLPPVRIETLQFTPSIDPAGLDVRVFLHAPAASWRIEIEALDDGEVVARTEVSTRRATAHVFLAIPNAKLWSPATPHLYNLRVRLWQGDEMLDEVASYAGIRSVELHDGRFVLNGEPLYLVMVLDQGYWLEGALAAPSDEALRADVEWAKRFGFNGVRKHQKIEDPRWLHWCDRLGLLVWGEMPNARAWSSEAEEALLAEWERAVRRDYNSPSVVTWVPINESWGFPNLQTHHPGQYAFLERAVAFTRRLDPERPVVDNDGWEHTDVSDILAIHDYSPTRERLLERYADTLGGGELPPVLWNGVNPLFAGNSAYRGQPVMLTEVGGFLVIPPGVPAERLDLLYRFYGTIASEAELLDRYRDLMHGIAELPFVAGFCYTQLTDIEQEINGLLTYDRRPKADPEAIAAIHRELFGARPCEDEPRNHERNEGHRNI